jgi:23S rRNA U2552 (ribose-2'-O)-methylase RlmE/FtsJ
MSIDLKDIEPIKDVKFLQGDIFEKKTKNEVIKYFNKNLDVIISDMAADTTGSKSLDSIRTNQLCAEVINFSKDTLKPKGVLVSKLFMGEDFIEVKNLAKSLFKKVNFFKPESSRRESKETYLHCEILRSL